MTTKKIRVGILGAASYSSGELIRILLRHPGVELTCLISETFSGQPVTVCHGFLHGISDLHFAEMPDGVDSFSLLDDQCDVVFMTKPHLFTARHGPAIMAMKARVIDLSGDYRLAAEHAGDYETYYGIPHPSPELLDRFVYGMPELNADDIQDAQFIANPGCYPTSVILGLAPLMGKGLVQPEGIVVDSISGISGAGKKPSASLMYLAVDENVRPYKTATHQHTPEIESVLSDLNGEPVKVLFSPSVGPYKVGIRSSIYARLSEAQTSLADIRACFEAFYQDAPFVRILPEGGLPELAHVAGTNFCDIGLVLDPRTGYLVIFSAEDNIIKGAAGQAVQNLNLMFGFPEATALPFGERLCS